MCIICKKEIMFILEYEYYVIDYIEMIVLKLRFFMEKKLESVFEMIDRLNYELDRVENVVRNILIILVSYI